jgi:hypothetical protein
MGGGHVPMMCLRWVGRSSYCWRQGQGKYTSHGEVWLILIASLHSSEELWHLTSAFEWSKGGSSNSVGVRENCALPHPWWLWANHWFPTLCIKVQLDATLNHSPWWCQVETSSHCPIGWSRYLLASHIDRRNRCHIPQPPFVGRCLFGHLILGWSSYHMPS